MTQNAREVCDDGVIAQLHFGSCTGAAHAGEPSALQRGVAVVVCTRDRPDLLARLFESMRHQTPLPAQLVIVDASRDDRTARLVEAQAAEASLAGCVRYCRLSPAHAGLTRQRCIALRLVTMDMLASFDDDIVLLPGCLAAMAQVLHEHPELVGVAASIDNFSSSISWKWRLRRILYVVPSLAPGRYFASGVPTPWRHLGETDQLTEGDWLPGGASLWRTAAARTVGYAEQLDGYGSAEDLEFSLRMASIGRMAMTPTARVLHLQEGPGRPDPRRRGFESVRNLAYIHRIASRTRRQSAMWFRYAMTMDVLIESLNLLRPRYHRQTVEYLRGVMDYWQTRRPGAGRRTDHPPRLPGRPLVRPEG